VLPEPKAKCSINIQEEPMQLLTRRELFWMMALASQNCKGRDPVQARPIVDFLKPIGKGRTFASINEGHKAKPGDVILVPELTQIAPSDTWRRSKPVANGNCDPTSLPMDSLASF